MRLFKRGRVWYCYVYVDGERVQRSTHAHDRHAAEAIARQWERDAADPDHAAARTASLSDALGLLLADRAEQAKVGRRSEATLRFYRTKAGNLVRILEMDEKGDRVPLPLGSLRARDVDAYISERREERASENTIAKELVTLRAALKLAKRRGMFRGDIAELLPAGFASEYRPRSRALSSEEMSLLLGELPPDRAARVAFIVATSACWGESERARREDVASDGSFVHIRGTKRATRLRRVPIVTDAQATLLAFALEHAGGTEGMLFATWTNVRRDLSLACERAGIARCSPNDLRRTCATWLRASGAPPDLIAPLMGHVDTRMVERVYGRLSPEELRVRLRNSVDPDCITIASDRTDLGRFGRPTGQTGATISREIVRDN